MMYHFSERRVVMSMSIEHDIAELLHTHIFDPAVERARNSLIEQGYYRYDEYYEAWTRAHEDDDDWTDVLMTTLHTEETFADIESACRE